MKMSKRIAATVIALPLMLVQCLPWLSAANITTVKACAVTTV